MMATEQNSSKILLFPFLAHGHLSPFFELAKNLSNHNFIVYFCSTPVNLKSFARNFVGLSIKQVEFHLQTSSELPPEYHTTKGLPPHLIFPLIYALENSSTTFSEILKSVEPDLVIYDINQPWLPNLATSFDIPSIYYQTSGAAAYSHFIHSMKCPDIKFPFSAIFHTEYEINSYRRVKDSSEDPDREKNKLLSCIEETNEIILIRTSRAFEEKYIDFQSTLVEKKSVSLGSLVSEPEVDLDDNSEIIKWLNGKEKASVVYVSFGSEVLLTKEELKEIALGLEISNVNFIWIVRCPDRDNTRLGEVLPEGFLDKIKGKGFIEDVWAPQTKILKHPSIGAFVTHCGWGSIVESISFGVPIIAMPMQYDQPVNARLVEELGVGLEVVREENGQRKREEIGKIIEKVLVKDEGEGIRRKARDLSKKVRAKSEEEVDVAVQELRQICDKKKKNYRS